MNTWLSELVSRFTAPKARMHDNLLSPIRPNQHSSRDDRSKMNLDQKQIQPGIDLSAFESTSYCSQNIVDQEHCDRIPVFDSYSSSDCGVEDDFVENKSKRTGTVKTVSTKYIRDLRHDNNDGEGTLILDESSFYRGKFKQGKFHGSGTLYEGDGRIYKGEWQSGFKSGAGEERMPDGSVYIGEFLQDQRSGVGTLLDKDQNVVYTGMWKHGLMHGEGIQFVPTASESKEFMSGNYLDKDEFRGTFMHGKRFGHGKLTMANGTTMRGQWLSDKPVDGEWRITHNDGRFFSGFAMCTAAEFGVSIPVPNGFGTIRFKNGDLYTGHLSNGKREGRGVCIFSNGDKWDGTWKGDAVDVDGTGVLTFADGTEHVFGDIMGIDLV